MWILWKKIRRHLSVRRTLGVALWRVVERRCWQLTRRYRHAYLGHLLLLLYQLHLILHQSQLGLELLLMALLSLANLICWRLRSGQAVLRPVSLDLVGWYDWHGLARRRSVLALVSATAAIVARRLDRLTQHFDILRLGSLRRHFPCPRF